MADVYLVDSVSQFLGLPQNFAGEIVVYTLAALLLALVFVGFCILGVELIDSMLNRLP